MNVCNPINNINVGLHKMMRHRLTQLHYMIEFSSRSQAIHTHNQSISLPNPKTNQVCCVHTVLHSLTLALFVEPEHYFHWSLVFEILN